MSPAPATGLLLLTGGQGRRLGAPKHDRPHPEGGTWGGHLVRVFEAALGPGPIHVLGHPLPDRPELPVFPDAGAGPAAALSRWAAQEAPPVLRWWVPACDQVRWTPEALQSWAALAVAADPAADHWVMGERDGLPQPLGGFLPHALRPALATAKATRLLELARSLPHAVCPWPGAAWEDLDELDDLARWQSDQGKPATF